MLNKSKQRGFKVPRGTESSQEYVTTSDVAPEWEHEKQSVAMKEGTLLHPDSVAPTKEKSRWCTPLWTEAEQRWKEAEQRDFTWDMDSQVKGLPLGGRMKKTEHASYNHERRCTSYSDVNPDGKMRQNNWDNLQITKVNSANRFWRK